MTPGFDLHHAEVADQGPASGSLQAEHIIGHLSSDNAVTFNQKQNYSLLVTYFKNRCQIVERAELKRMRKRKTVLTGIT